MNLFFQMGKGHKALKDKTGDSLYFFVFNSQLNVKPTTNDTNNTKSDIV